MKLAGGLSFASSVAMAKFGRPFLQPLYAVAAAKVIPPEPETLAPELWAMGPRAGGLATRTPPPCSRALTLSRAEEPPGHAGRGAFRL